MIKFTIEGKDYFHPNKIEEVTLRQFQDLKSVEFDEDATPFENNILGFSRFSKIPMEVLTTLKKKELIYHIMQLHEMLESVAKQDKLIEKFKIGRYNYHVPKDFDYEETGNYISCTHMMNKFKAMESEPAQTAFYPYMMAIYCLRKDEKQITMEQLEERAEIMRDARVSDALNVNTFFLISSRGYLEDFQLYLGENQPVSKSKQEAET